MAAPNKRNSTNRQVSNGSIPYTCSELYEALKSLQITIHCCSCRTPMQTAITCLKGHAVCSTCKEQSKDHCPRCQSCVPDVEPALLNSIIKLLPRPCKLSERGCDIIVLPGNSDHESFCRFRLTDCKMWDCEWEGEARCLLQHLERVHGRDMIRSAVQEKVLTNFNTNIERNGVAVIVAYNNIFWQHIRVREQWLMQVYQYVPMTRPSGQFRVKVTVADSNTNYTDTFLIHTESSDPDQLFNGEHKFCLPKEISKSFSHSPCIKYGFKILNDNES